MNILLFTLAVSFRITGIADCRTLSAKSAEQSVTIQLAGIECSGPATAAMLARLTENRIIYIEPAGRPQGQLIGYVYRWPDGLFINLEMIHAGYATASPAPHRFGSSFIKAENAARAAHRGLWSANPSAADWESRFSGVRYLGETSPRAPNKSVEPQPKVSSKKRKKQ